MKVTIIKATSCKKLCSVTSLNMIKALSLVTVLVSTVVALKPLRGNLNQPYEVSFQPKKGESLIFEGSIRNDSKIILTIHSSDKDFIKTIVRIPYDAITFTQVQNDVDLRYPHHLINLPSNGRVKVKLTFNKNFVLLHFGNTYIGAVNYPEGYSYNTYKYVHLNGFKVLERADVENGGDDDDVDDYGDDEDLEGSSSPAFEFSTEEPTTTTRKRRTRKGKKSGHKKTRRSS
uniref:Galectin n=1 Tax=Panagrellus redivivus TaxID=6233 RepID=A0A7E4VLS8_PANRE